jgi:hypothetical protein
MRMPNQWSSMLLPMLLLLPPLALWLVGCKSKNSDDDVSGGECGSDDGDGELLAVVESWEIPTYGTGAPSVFTDLYVSDEPKLYLVNDQQDCEIALVGGAPDFDGSGSFCALTPGFRLRGWTRFQAVDYIVDVESRSIVPGDSSGSIALPKNLQGPSGLASDPGQFWVSDGAGNRLVAISPEGVVVAQFGGPGPSTESVTWDGDQLWVLAGGQVVEMTAGGTVCRSMSLDVTLAGFSVQGTSGWGVDRHDERLYRFTIPVRDGSKPRR